MYISQEIVKRIKDVSTQKNISSNQLLTGCGLGKNTINKMSAGTDILTKNFAKIADYLNVSVDYLLGRTDRSELLTSDEAQLLEAYNSSLYVKNAIDGLLGIGNVKQIPINRDDTTLP